eukprot:132924-Rhodomonas_salina.1
MANFWSVPRGTNRRTHGTNVELPRSPERQYPGTRVVPLPVPGYPRVPGYKMEFGNFARPCPPS